MNQTLEYEPIADLPEDWPKLAVTELRGLSAVWDEQRIRLDELDELQQFKRELVRRWAIETGVIERVYSIERGVTELLIERGIEETLLVGATDRHPAEVLAVLRDHQDTLEGLFDFVADRRELTTSYIKELHQSLTRNQASSKAMDQFGRVFDVPLLHGDWKRDPNNPTRDDGSVHLYAPPVQVASEMDRLVALHSQHSDVPPEVEAAWLHHRFTQIHPFQDGNGRVARTLASAVYLQAGWFPLSIDPGPQPKKAYLDALEAADAGNLQPLCALFGAVAKANLVRALSVGETAERDIRGIKSVIAAARDRMLQTAADTTAREFAQAKENADHLVEVCVMELGRIKDEIRREIADNTPQFSATLDVSTDQGPNAAKWYRATQFRIATQEHYFANLAEYGTWVRLRITDGNAGSRHDLVICLHAMGRTFRGLIAGVAFFEHWDRDEEAGRMVQTEQNVVAGQLFQINHREDQSTAQARFSDWLMEAATLALGIWERSLGDR